MNDEMPRALWVQRMGGVAPGCWSQREALARLASELRDDSVQRAQVELLAVLAAWRLDPSNMLEPFSPIFEVAGPSMNELNEPALEVLRALAPQVESPDLAARVWDVLWSTNRKDRGAAVKAIELYCAAATAIASGPHEVWDRPVTRLRRALTIGRLTKSDEAPMAVRASAELLMRDDTVRGDVRVHAAELLTGWKGDVASEAGRTISALAEETAAAGRSAPVDWDWVRYAFGAAAEAMKAGGAAEAQLSLLKRRADTYVEQADFLESQTDASALLVTDRLRYAIQAHRDLGATTAEVELLHRRLLAKQHGSLGEFVRYESVSADVSEQARAAIAAVSGKSFSDALVTLARLRPPPKRESQRALARIQLQRFPLQFLFARKNVDREGRVVSAQPSTTGEPSDEVLDAHSIEYAAIEHHALIVAVVNPAREQIASEHPALIDEWSAFVASRPLVRPERARTVALGLAAGFRADLITAVHVLAPQLEHMLRLIVRGAGGITSTLESGEGFQKESALSSLLERPELLTVLGEDWVFDLKGFLDHPSGANLRNRTAHGLLDDADFRSSEGLYLWFTVLRLIVAVGIADGSSAVP